MDFPIPPSSWWSTDNLSASIFLQGVDQKILPCGQGRDSVKINPSLLMMTDCLWQTCWVGSDSCFWTVICPANDNECYDMIHNSNFHVNDDPITCKACFNTACPGCEEAWENSCQNGAEMGHGITACKNGDVQEGWDCGNGKRLTVLCKEDTTWDESAMWCPDL